MTAGGHEREPWKAVSFVEAVEEFWDILSQQQRPEELEGENDDE